SPRLRRTSFGMKVTSSWTSRLGWRASMRIVSPWLRSCMGGFTYGVGALTETCAKLVLVGLWGLPDYDVEMAEDCAKKLQDRRIRCGNANYLFDQSGLMAVVLSRQFGEFTAH